MSQFLYPSRSSHIFSNPLSRLLFFLIPSLLYYMTHTTLTSLLTPHHLFFPSLDAIFGSDSGQMYRSSVPFRANDPLLQVPYHIPLCFALHVKPPSVSYPPRHRTALHCHNSCWILHYCMLHHCIRPNPAACHTTTLFSTPLYAMMVHLALLC
jgi:hypothetical protein